MLLLLLLLGGHDHLCVGPLSELLVVMLLRIEDELRRNRLLWWREVSGKGRVAERRGDGVHGRRAGLSGPLRDVRVCEVLWRLERRGDG